MHENEVKESMVNHIVMWKFRQELSQEEKNSVANEMKTQMEAIVKKMSDVQSLSVITAPLESSNCDILLIGCFSTKEALSAYQNAPEHVRLKSRLMPFFASRTCVDY